MATAKGHNGEDVFTISGGNPFYVNEILASYIPGVPDWLKKASKHEIRLPELYDLINF